LQDLWFSNLMRPPKSTRSPKIRKPSPTTSEFLTRKQIIDSKLRAAGWSISPFKPERALSAYKNCAIEEYPTDSGPADYALCVGGQILGVVEAKKLTLGPQEVLPQAERYSRGASASPFDFNGFRAPFRIRASRARTWHQCTWRGILRENQRASRATAQQEKKVVPFGLAPHRVEGASGGNDASAGVSDTARTGSYPQRR
jgi:type I site-specific restriction endonuclease